MSVCSDGDTVDERSMYMFVIESTEVMAVLPPPMPTPMLWLDPPLVALARLLLLLPALPVLLRAVPLLFLPFGERRIICCIK